MFNVVAVPLRHTFWTDEAGWVLITGAVFTVTVTFFVIAQLPRPVLETVYVVVLVGVAVTVAPDEALSVAAGLQEKRPLPPEAVRVTLPPSQIVAAAGEMFRKLTPEIAAIVNVQ